MRNPFELPEDVALVDVWREVVVDAEKSIELLHQGHVSCGVSRGERIDRYRDKIAVALQEIEDLTNDVKDIAAEPVVLNGEGDGVANVKKSALSVETEDGAMDTKDKEDDTLDVKINEVAGVVKDDDTVVEKNKDVEDIAVDEREDTIGVKNVDGAKVNNEEGSLVIKKDFEGEAGKESFERIEEIEKGTATERVVIKEKNKDGAKVANEEVGARAASEEGGTKLDKNEVSNRAAKKEADGVDIRIEKDKEVIKGDAVVSLNWSPSS